MSGHRMCVCVPFLALQVLAAVSLGQPPRVPGPSRQSPTQFTAADHGLLRDGKPFFWQGDTGWLLFQMNPEDVRRYLDDRAAKHFNVIQIMAIRTGIGQGPDSDVLVPNYAGELPFTGVDPVTLNEEYWRHIDFIIDAAGERNLTVALAAMWGHNADSLFPNTPEPGKPATRSSQTAAHHPQKCQTKTLRNNERYGNLLGRRYRDRGNVIWLVTGEYEKINDNWSDDKQAISDEQRELLRAIARGLEAGHEGRHLMTIHPVGTSSDDFHDDSWLDFNMQQTWGHANANVLRIRADYLKRPFKPVLNGEPGYENRPEPPTSTAWKCRYEGYWSVFSGAFGYTYGASPIWRFQPGWQDALNYEGAADMQHLRFLIESRLMQNRIADQSLLLSGAGSLHDGFSYCAAARASDGTCAMVYSTMGKPFTVDLPRLSPSRVNAWWYSPRDGRCYDGEAHESPGRFETVDCREPQEFTPPTSGTDQDWVLVLDDPAQSFSAPGIQNTDH